MKVPQRESDWNPKAKRLPRILARVGVAAGLAGAFVMAALLIEPSDSPAGPARSLDAPAPVEESPKPLVAPSPEHIPLGSLEGLEHTLHIFGTPEGVRFTALDPLGNPIAFDLPADEVYRVLPDANVDRMIAGPLMLADID